MNLRVAAVAVITTVLVPLDAVSAPGPSPQAREALRQRARDLDGGRELVDLQDAAA